MLLFPSATLPRSATLHLKVADSPLVADRGPEMFALLGRSGIEDCTVKNKRMI